MALNFGGVGFGFVGKDEGLTKTLDAVKGGFMGIWNGFKKLASGSGRMAAKVMGAVTRVGGAAKGAMGRVAGLIDGMTSKALSPRIDNAFSSMYATFNKTFGAITVGMGLSSKEASKWRRVIGSTAHALNADMGEAAKGWAEFRKQGIRLDTLLGVKGMGASIKGLIKLTSTLGIEGRELALMTSGLVKGFGFTENRVKTLLDQVFFMGKQFGVGKEVIAGMPAIIKTLNTELATFFKGKPEEVEKMSKGIVKLGIAFKEGLGTSAEQGMELAKNVFVTITKEWKNIGTQFIGKGGAIGELAKGLTEAGGDFNKVMKMFMDDPTKFMKGLSKMAKEAKKSGGETGTTFLRLEDTINKAFGPDATFMVKGGWDNASKAIGGLNELMKDTKQVTGALMNAVNKSFTDGRTRGEAYQLMLDGFQARLDRLSDPMVNKWIKDQKTGFKEVEKSVSKLAKKEGPLGELTRRFLLVQRVGLSGLFTGLGGLGPVMTQTLTKMGPMLSAFAALGMSLSMVGRLLLPGGILLVGLALFHEGARKKIVGALTSAFEYVKKKAPEWGPKIRDALVMAFKFAVKGAVWLAGVLGDLFSQLVAYLKTVDWGHVAMVVGEGLLRVMKALGSFIIKAISGIGDLISSVDWAAVGKQLAFFLGKTIFWVFTRLIPGLGKALLKLAVALWNAIAGIFKGLWGELEKFLGDQVKPILDIIAWPFKMLWRLVAKIINIIKDIWTGKVSFLKGIGQLVWTIISWPYKMLVSLVETVWNSIVSAFNQAADALKAGVQLMWDVISWPFRKLWSLAGNTVKTVVRVFWGMIKPFVKVGRAIWKAITYPFRKISGFVKSVFNKVKGAVHGVLKKLGIESKTAYETANKFLGGALGAGVGPGAMQKIGFREALGRVTKTQAEVGRAQLAMINIQKRMVSMGNQLDLSTKEVSRTNKGFVNIIKKWVTKKAEKGEQYASGALVAEVENLGWSMTKVLSRSAAKKMASKQLAGIQGIPDIKKAQKKMAQRITKILLRRIQAGETLQGAGAEAARSFGLLATAAKGMGEEGEMAMPTIGAMPAISMGGPPKTAKVSGKVKMERKQMIDRQLSEDSKKVMGDVANQLETLAASIRDIKIVVQATGDIKQFIRFAASTWHNMQTRRESSAAAGMASRMGTR